MSLRKRQRSRSSSCLSSNEGAPSPSLSSPALPPPPPISFSGADVHLRLQLSGKSVADADCPGETPPFLDLHVSSSSLLRSRYFAALLSGRWSDGGGHLTLQVAAGRGRKRWRNFDAHVSVIRLLHTLDFPATIRSAADALDLLPVALELLFDDCVATCLRFLESVPWSDEEEARVLELAPLLTADESNLLLARVSPPASGDAVGGGKPPSEAMLHGLINLAINGHPGGGAAAATKAFVATILRDYPSRDCVHKVLDEAFMSLLETVKELMGKYASPDFRVAGDNEEREAIERINLHSAAVNVKHLYWLIERMTELGVAGNAVKAWSEQAALASDLQKILGDGAWKNISPGLPVLVARCTFRLANSVVTGVNLAPREVRLKLVKDWLPVLYACRDMFVPMMSGNKPIYQELEETFLQMISTLPLSDAQELLQQCLGFSTRNVDDCPHLFSAFRTWFRRADQIPNVSTADVPSTAQNMLWNYGVLQKFRQLMKAMV